MTVNFFLHSNPVVLIFFIVFNWKLADTVKFIRDLQTMQLGVKVIARGIKRSNAILWGGITTSFGIGIVDLGITNIFEQD